MNEEEKLNKLIQENLKSDPIAQLYNSISTKEIIIEDTDFNDFIIEGLRESGTLMLAPDNEDIFSTFDDKTNRPAIDPTILLTWQEVSKLRQDMADNMQVFNTILERVVPLLPENDNINLITHTNE